MTDTGKASAGREEGGSSAFFLVPLNAQMRKTFQRSRAEFSQSLKLDLPEGWPEFPEAFGTDAPQEGPPWTGYLFLANGALVGNGGFVGPPDQEGAVEIGYEIAPDYRNQGHATRAVRQLIELAFRSGASRIIAHSLALPNASNAVMTKAGMRLIATCSHPEVGLTWRYAIEAPSG
jgi:RimJ/RimL family protein N-acetyltransferase